MYSKGFFILTLLKWRAEILKKFHLFFGRNNDTMNSFWNLLTISTVRFKKWGFFYWFVEELKTPNCPCEINWPLVLKFEIWHKWGCHCLNWHPWQVCWLRCSGGQNMAKKSSRRFNLKYITLARTEIFTWNLGHSIDNGFVFKEIKDKNWK